ncbi:MAG: hypothetical protein J6Z20_04940 [Bacteroidales bacterium]|nr:hypothetical protein [Bacteroidales bacterium]
MNIALKTYSGAIVVRPDTTWERDNEDLFLPDFVTGLEFTPVLAIQVTRPGRSISAKFAGRYYGNTGYGVLLYPKDLLKGEEGFAEASCMDHTSFIAMPDADRRSEAFVLECNGQKVFEGDGAGIDIDALIAEITKRIYIRTGDIVAIELAPRKALPHGNLRITGASVDFNVIME